MSITIAKPTVLDLLLLCNQARPDEIMQYEALVGKEWVTEEVAVDFFVRDGTKFVLLEGDKPICAGGYDLIIPGVWHSWMVGTMENWDTHWRSITKYSRRVMDGLFEEGARRLQTCVLAERKKACEWYVRGLKMQFEGSMRNFGSNGETMDMYARIREIGNGQFK